MKKKYLTLFSLSGLILSCDQLLKNYVQAHFQPDEVSPIFSSLLSLVYRKNSGFAFGLLQKAPPSLQEVFFIGVPVFALVLIVLIFIKLRDNQMPTSVALTTILAGAMGNLIDRLQYGYVIDVFVGMRLPPFNIADVSILAGVLLMFFNTWRQERQVADAR